MKVYGPVPSRRLGRSLGINNIPPKICSYSCVYCQLGRTIKTQLERRVFYDIEELEEAIHRKMEKIEDFDEKVDYISFVPDGEPTLDRNLGKAIDLVGSYGVKIAVITNASLLWDDKVRDDLVKADWVSLKVDAALEETWRRTNRPSSSLEFDRVIKGIEIFSSEYGGTLATESMLVRDLNDNKGEVRSIANFLGEIDPDLAYVAVPTRPPAEKWISPPGERDINLAYQTFDEEVLDVEYLIGYEGGEFTQTGEVKKDLLDITSVHPMRKDALDKFLSRAGSGWEIIEDLLGKGKLVEIEYDDDVYYMRKLPGRNEN